MTKVSLPSQRGDRKVASANSSSGVCNEDPQQGCGNENGQIQGADL
jgi:hypothetical protein